MTKSLFCFGYGYVAQNLIAELIKDDAWTFRATTRADKTGIEVKLLNYNELTLLPRDITHVLISIPPKENGDVIVNQFANQLKLLPNLKWVGYLSATSVYGDTKGEYVDENSPLKPQNQHAKNRLVAEEQWKNLDLPLNIFRLSGIYGPGRSAIDRIKAGHLKIVEKKGQVFSRIHIDDIEQTLKASINQSTKDQTFNLADDYPCSSKEVMEYACKLLDIKAPKAVPPEDAGLNEMGKSFYSECRRIKNDKFKKDLGINLKYPTYKEGLKAQLQTY